jgi:hypothetical protein
MVRGRAVPAQAKDRRAARWYERFGARALLDDPCKLFLPLESIADAIGAPAKRNR